MTNEEINEIRKTLIEILDTVKVILQEYELKHNRFMILEGEFIILRDICNLLHLANEGDTHKLLIMLDAYKESKKQRDSAGTTMYILGEVIDRDL